MQPESSFFLKLQFHQAKKHYCI